jgi:DNA-binding response OmpR family regulator
MSRILVAEDSFALSNLLRFVLTNAGLEPDVHNAGDKALEAGLASEYDLVILDQQMPGLTGLEVAERLREESPNMETPICLCTAKTHELDIKDVKERLNLARVFHKPFSPKDLVSQIKAVLDEELANN